MVLTVVIPAKNEERNLKKLLPEIRKLSFVNEIIVVDDGSTDETTKISKKLGAKVITHPKNMGKGVAISDGVEASTNEKIVLMDADLQHSPDDLEKFRDKLEEHDLVVGERNYQKMPFWRTMSNYMCSVIVSIRSGKQFEDVLCGYRGIQKSKFAGILKSLKGYEVELGMIHQASKRKYKITTINVETIYGGASQMKTKHFIQLMAYTAKLLFRRWG